MCGISTMLCAPSPSKTSDHGAEQQDVGIEIDHVVIGEAVEQVAEDERFDGSVELDDRVPKLHVRDQLDTDLVAEDQLGRGVQARELPVAVCQNDEAVRLRMEFADRLHEGDRVGDVVAGDDGEDGAPTRSCGPRRGLTLTRRR